MPIAPVSPSPLTPIAISLRLASTAPVPTDGIRPCTVLKPCAEPRKYAGLLLEQPMPESLMTPRGSTPISKNASMIRSEIALCPQPAHSVVLPPRYGAISRPMRLIFLPGSGVAVVVIRTLAARLAIGRRHQRVGVMRALQTFLLLDGVGHRAGVDRQAAVVQHAAQPARRARARNRAASARASARRGSARRRRSAGSDRGTRRARDVNG